MQSPVRNFAYYYYFCYYCHSYYCYYYFSTTIMFHSIIIIIIIIFIVSCREVQMCTEPRPHEQDPAMNVQFQNLQV